MLFRRIWRVNGENVLKFIWSFCRKIKNYALCSSAECTSGTACPVLALYPSQWTSFVERLSCVCIAVFIHVWTIVESFVAQYYVAFWNDSAILYVIWMLPDVDSLCDLLIRVPGSKSRSFGFDSRHYQMFWVALCLLGLVNINEERLERKSSRPFLENRD
jgi:hypothetical protein